MLNHKKKKSLKLEMPLELKKRLMIQKVKVWPQWRGKGQVTVTTLGSSGPFSMSSSCLAFLA